MREIFARANLRKSIFYLINNKINNYRVTQIMSHTFLTLFALLDLHYNSSDSLNVVEFHPLFTFLSRL